MNDRLRIAIVANEFPALSETFVLNHVTGLIARGHDVTVLANRPRAEALSHAAAADPAVRERTIYRRMPANRAVRAVAGLGVLARLGVRRHPARWRALDLRRFGREAASLALLYWADRLRDEAPFDIVHCHFGTVGRTAAYLREIGALGGPLVVTFHGVDVSAVLDADADAYRRLFRTADLFLPISNLWRERLIAHGCPPERTVVHRVGIDTAQFAFRPRDVWVRPLRVLAVGRLVEKKGFRYACEAVALARRRGLDVELTIVGDGPLREELARLAREDGLRGHVHFAGWQDGAALRRRYDDSDVLLAPSVTDAAGDKEGIPVTLMEAMASGLPVVSSRHSGIPELVAHGVSGLLAPERDVEALASALSTLAESPALARRLAIHARETVVAEFDRRTLEGRLEKMYRALAENGRAAGRRSPATPPPASRRHPIAASRA